MNTFPPMAPAPNPEISDTPRKRTFSAEEKHRILQEAENCTQPGQISALLRREGIYSSYLTTWRRTLLTQGTQALTPEKPGRKYPLAHPHLPPTLPSRDVGAWRLSCHTQRKPTSQELNTGPTSLRNLNAHSSVLKRFQRKTISSLEHFIGGGGD